MYERWGKRAFDLATAILGGVVLSPVIVAAWTLIRLFDGPPAIFRQRRVGRDGGAFTIYKFRTYPVGTPELASADATELKPTAIGRFLRRTNIDELPQLFNVLIGDMSIVGPRPGLPSQSVQMRIRRENGAERLRPGVTGLAQIRGEDRMPEAAKAANDGEYARRVSFLTDLGIIARTLVFIVRRAPVY